MHICMLRRRPRRLLLTILVAPILGLLCLSHLASAASPLRPRSLLTAAATAAARASTTTSSLRPLLPIHPSRPALLARPRPRLGSYLLAATSVSRPLGSHRPAAQSLSGLHYYSTQRTTMSSSSSSSSSPLHRLRPLLAGLGADALIVGSGDAHQSEYVATCDERRAFISGFTGSAGTALVLGDGRALLWTDGRYFLQAAQELSADWTLMKSGEPGVLELDEWLLSNLKAGQSVAVDPWLYSAGSARALERKLAARGIKLVALEHNPIHDIWTDRPARSDAPAIFHPLEFSGETTSSKVERVRAKISKEDAHALVISALDDVAWLFNIRGADVEFNPVATAYGVVTLNEGLHLFIDADKVASAPSGALDGITIHAYEDIEAFLKNLSSRGLKTMADPAQLNWRLYRAIESNVVEAPSPISLPKSLKNCVELQGMRNAHIRDGVALTAFIAWMHETIRSGARELTEFDVSEIIETYRNQMDLHVSPSFATIAGYGKNGAIIHYRPSADACARVETGSLFLLDSGAQYRDGTTDVTRTMHFGTPTERMRTCFTHVLKGMIALSSAVFPEGVLGSRLDALARTSLWTAGLDYNHGTGHGVGAFLNVHEGPQGIGYRKRENEVGFMAGMVTSNEPGYYEDGNFGIRIENLMTTVTAATPNNFAGRKYCKFEPLTLVPIQTDLIDLSLLTEVEVAWLNAYHAQVRETLLPLMREKFPQAVDYLVSATAPVSK